MKKWFFLASFLFLGAVVAVAQEPEGSQTTISKQKVTVFPNPASNVVNVLGLKNTDRAQIILSDINGNQIKEYNWQIKNQAVNLPVAEYKAGIYVIHIVSKEQDVRTKFYKK